MTVSRPDSVTLFLGPTDIYRAGSDKFPEYKSQIGAKIEVNISDSEMNFISFRKDQPGIKLAAKDKQLQDGWILLGQEITIKECEHKEGYLKHFEIAFFL